MVVLFVLAKKHSVNEHSEKQVLLSYWIVGDDGAYHDPTSGLNFNLQERTLRMQHPADITPDVFGSTVGKPERAFTTLISPR